MNIQPDMAFVGSDEFAEPGMHPPVKAQRPSTFWADTIPADEMARESGIAPFDGDEPEPESHTWATIVGLLSTLAAVLWLATQIRLPL